MSLKMIKKNIIMLGDGAVGKTSLIRRFVIDDYSDNYIQTIGTKVTKKELQIGPADDKKDMVLMIWDIIGLLAQKPASGGSAYDAFIIEILTAAGAEAIATFDVEDFKRLSTSVRIVSPV